MAWDHLSINRPHLVYIILGGFTSLFMLCSSFIKERLYIGEATVATLCGIIFGPHAADLINPGDWGNVDQVTLEFSRIVLVVQCFAVGVELPKYYMEKHWRSVVFLLIPVMTFGWLITSLFVWWMILPLTWLESLCVAACVTATDPVLASSVVGKGKFAKRVPKHLRDLLSAESGCNDGMAFPFIYLALYLIHYKPHADKVSFHWIVITILYECVFGAFYGFMVGYIGRHGIKFAEKHDLVDRESFLVFYFVLALFCAGSGSILGVDDLLVGFAAGIGFSNDGWFTQKTEESHVSNVIDLLINLAYFVYLGTIIPWDQFNSPELGTTPWRLVVISLFVLFFRRIPIMLALKPLIPDIKTWREALFAGHFGPIGVGAIFVAILARAELETDSTTPLAEYPDPEAENYLLVALIWPITVFLVVVSIIVHGSSIAVFTLGKHINTLTLTMSYTTAGEEGPGWMNRLPRISTGTRSQAKSFTSETDGDELKMDEFPPGTLPPTGMPREFLRRQKEEDTGRSRPSTILPRRRKKKSSWDDGHGPGGPISESAIYPQRRPQREDTSDTLTPGGSSPENEKGEYDEKGEGKLGEVQDDPEMHEIRHRNSNEKRREQHMSDAERHPEQKEVYDEGDDIIVENEDGDVVGTDIKHDTRDEIADVEKEVKQDIKKGNFGNMKKKVSGWRHRGEEESTQKDSARKRGPALAYQFGNTIIVEDEDGEVVKTYALPSSKAKEGEGSTRPGMGMGRMSTWLGGRKESIAPGAPIKDAGNNASSSPSATAEKQADPPANPEGSAMRQQLSRMGTWGFGGKTQDTGERKAEGTDEDDDRRIRFTIGGAGRRLTKEDFLREIQSLDPKARCEIVESSDAPAGMKALARKDASTDSPGSSRLFHGKEAQAASGKAAAKGIGAKMAVARGAKLDETKELEEESDSEHERAQDRGVKNVLQLSRRKDAPVSGRVQSHKESPSDVPETAAERKRRVDALKGVEEDDEEEEEDDDGSPGASSSSSRIRGRGRDTIRDKDGDGTADYDDNNDDDTYGESAAERRRRIAALGGSGRADDSDDEDGSLRIPPPVAKPPRGIRFAQSPVRQGKK